MKKIIIATILLPTLLACFSCSDKQSVTGSKKPELTDTANVRHNAQLLVKDMKERMNDGDIETFAALAQEATDVVTYARTTGDTVSSRIYVYELRRFIEANATTIGDMASENYVVKQMATTIMNMKQP